jgi:hypothetical protein
MYHLRNIMIMIRTPGLPEIHLRFGEPVRSIMQRSRYAEREEAHGDGRAGVDYSAVRERERERESRRVCNGEDALRVVCEWSHMRVGCGGGGGSAALCCG